MAAVKVDARNVHEFANEQSFYVWLGKNWDRETEVWISDKRRSAPPAAPRA